MDDPETLATNPTKNTTQYVLDTAIYKTQDKDKQNKTKQKTQHNIQHCKNPTKCVGLVQSRRHHHFIEISITSRFCLNGFKVTGLYTLSWIFIVLDH